VKRWWEKLVHADPGDRNVVDNVMLGLLQLLSIPFRVVSRLQLHRRHAHVSCQWTARVISVGNITVGGSGKTPITIHLARLIIDRGKRVAIVHSGYGRRENRDYFIEPGGAGQYTPGQIGDEVLMMQAELPEAAFAVGHDKKEMVRLADRKFHPDIILMDDGYQRRDIAKEIDIAVIASGLIAQDAGLVPRTTCFQFPRGVLREPMAALKRADLIFIVADDDIGEDYDKTLKAYNSQAETILWKREIGTIVHNEQNHDIDYLSGYRPFVFASIGSFSLMMKMIRGKGNFVAGHYNFGDHHTYNEKDYRQLGNLSDAAGADCYLTTAKDMVKLPPSGLDKPVYYLRLEMIPDRPDRLAQLVEQELS